MKKDTKTLMDMSLDEINAANNLYKILGYGPRQAKLNIKKWVGIHRKFLKELGCTKIPKRIKL